MKAIITKRDITVQLELDYREAVILSTLLSATALGSTDAVVGNVLLEISKTLDEASIPFKELYWTNEQFDALSNAMRMLCDITLEEFDALKDVP